MARAQRLAVQSHTFESLEARQLLAANLGGALDSSFGTGGKTNLSGFPAIVGLAVDSSRRELVTGTTSNGDIFLARLVDGKLDSAFGGGDGKVTQSLGGTETVADIAIQSNGRILVTGKTTATQSGRTGVFVARFNTDGTLDTTFLGTGFAVGDFGFPMAASAIAVEADGSIVVTGTETSVSTGGALSGFVVHLTGRGRFDTAFGTGGIARLTGSGVDPLDVATASSGDIYIVGSKGGSPSPFIAHLDEQGDIDPAFPTNPTASGGVFNAVAVDSSGRIIAAGETGANETLVERFTPQGVVDGSFANLGIFTAVIGAANGNTATGALDVALDSNDNILLGGIATKQGTTTLTNDFLVARINKFGQLDANYGTTGAGFTQVDFGNNVDDAVNHIAVDASGAVVAAGSSTATPFNGPIIRLTGDNGVATPPRGSLGGIPILRSSIKYFPFTVTYTSTEDIDLSSLDGNDLIVTGPNGFARRAVLVSATFGKSHTTAIVSYAVRAPNSLWTRSLNGTYDVHLQGGQVANVDGQTSVGRNIGSIVVRIPKATV